MTRGDDRRDDTEDGEETTDDGRRMREGRGFGSIQSSDGQSCTNFRRGSNQSSGSGRQIASTVRSLFGMGFADGIQSSDQTTASAAQRLAWSCALYLDCFPTILILPSRGETPALLRVLSSPAALRGACILALEPPHIPFPSQRLAPNCYLPDGAYLSRLVQHSRASQPCYLSHVFPFLS